MQWECKTTFLGKHLVSVHIRRWALKHIGAQLRGQHREDSRQIKVRNFMKRHCEHYVRVTESKNPRYFAASTWRRQHSGSGLGSDRCLGLEPE
jgi:hypothetical protein